MATNKVRHEDIRLVVDIETAKSTYTPPTPVTHLSKQDDKRGVYQPEGCNPDEAPEPHHQFGAEDHLHPGHHQNRLMLAGNPTESLVLSSKYFWPILEAATLGGYKRLRTLVFSRVYPRNTAFSIGFPTGSSHHCALEFA